MKIFHPEKRLPKAIFAVSALVFISSVLAAVPVKVKYIEDIITADDEIYAYFVVTCSDESVVDISAYDDKKLWCVGKGKKEECEPKQIKIAKKVCKE